MYVLQGSYWDCDDWFYCKRSIDREIIETNDLDEVIVFFEHRVCNGLCHYRIIDSNGRVIRTSKSRLADKEHLTIDWLREGF